MGEVRREIVGSKSPTYERKHHVFLKEPKRTVLVVGGLAKQKTQARPAFQKPPSSHHRQQLNKWPPDEYLLIWLLKILLYLEWQYFYNYYDSLTVCHLMRRRLPRKLVEIHINFKREFFKLSKASENLTNRRVLSLLLYYGNIYNFRQGKK